MEGRGGGWLVGDRAGEGALAVELENSLWELSDVYLSVRPPPPPRVLTVVPAALLGATRLVFLLLCSEGAAGGEGCLSQNGGTTLGRTLGH